MRWMVVPVVVLMIAGFMATGCSEDEAVAVTTWSWTVRFDSQGAGIPASPAEMTVASPATTVAALPAEPLKDGFYFGGWYVQPNGEGARFLASTTVTNHCTVYAFWSAVPVYTVSFDSKGGSAVESLLVRKDQPVE